MSIDFLIEGANNLIWSVPLIGLCLIVGLLLHDPHRTSPDPQSP